MEIQFNWSAKLSGDKIDSRSCSEEVEAFALNDKGRGSNLGCRRPQSSKQVMVVALPNAGQNVRQYKPMSPVRVGGHDEDSSLLNFQA